MAEGADGDNGEGDELFRERIKLAYATVSTAGAEINDFTNIINKPLKLELDTTHLQKGIDTSITKTNTLENTFGKQLKDSVKEVEGSVVSLQKEIEVSTEKAKELADTLKDGAKKIDFCCMKIR